ncbi:MAG: hypothetical protein P1T08_04405 [Acidimicrobiia bacterium]|nr:hypothetical protein [Acidimicrobiia bacterium]
MRIETMAIAATDVTRSREVLFVSKSDELHQSGLQGVLDVIVAFEARVEVGIRRHGGGCNRDQRWVVCRIVRQLPGDQRNNGEESAERKGPWSSSHRDHPARWGALQAAMVPK